MFKFKVSNKLILKSLIVVSFVFYLGIPTFAAGTLHESNGLVSNGQSTDNYTFYVVNRPSEKLTGSLISVVGKYLWSANAGTLKTPWKDKEDSLVFISRSGSGKAYYGVMNEDLDITTANQDYNAITMREIPKPTATTSSSNVTLSWSQLTTDTSATPHGNNIASFNVYRSTSATSGFSKIGTKTGNNSSNTYTDSTGTAGTTYYYAIEPVFRGGVALGVYGAASSAVNYPAGSPTISLSKSSIAVTITEGQSVSNQTFTVGNTGSGTLNYTVSEPTSVSWMDQTPKSGTISSGGSNQTITVSFPSSASNLKAASSPYTGTIRISDSNATNNPQNISVTITVKPKTTAPSAPTGLSATNITAASADFSWNAVSGATSYDISYGTDANATNLGQKTGLTTTSHSVSTGLTVGSKINWKVRARNSAGSSSYSTASFITEANNLGHSNVSQSSADLAWSANSAATSFTISYGTDANASNVGTIPNITSTSHTLSSLNSGTAYYWKVKVFYGSQSSDWSHTDMVTTATPSSPQITSITWDTTKPLTVPYVYGQIKIKGTKFGGGTTGAKDAPSGSKVEFRLQGSSTWLQVPDTGADEVLYWWNDTSIDVGIPFAINTTNLVAGTITVRVTNAQGSSTDTFKLSPKINSIKPEKGQTGDTILINGTGFDTTATNNNVSFNGTVASKISFVDGTKDATLEVEVPSGATSGLVTVEVNGQISNAVYDWDTTKNVEFTITTAPTQPVVNDPIITSLKSSQEGSDKAFVYNNLIIEGKNLGQGTDTSKAPQDYFIELELAAKDPGSGSAIIFPILEDSLQDNVYYWSKNKIEIGLPYKASFSTTNPDDFAPIIAGQAKLNIITPHNNTQETFAIRPKVWSVTPVKGEIGDIIKIEGNAFDYMEQQDNIISFNGVTIEPLGIEVGKDKLTMEVEVPQGATTGQLLVTTNGQVSNKNYEGSTQAIIFTLTSAPTQPVTPTGEAPSISGVSNTNPSLGQTIIITGTKFGTPDSSSVIRLGTTVAKPTSWTDSQIVVAIPSELPTGQIDLVVVTSKGEDTFTLDIAANKIMVIDDFEGGAVGNFTEPNKNSGYYVFANVQDITPDNNDINAQLRTGEAKHSDTYGAKVKYSFVGTDGSNWGGGWGAKLANTLDLDDVENIELYVKWDGSSNAFGFGLQDSDGTAVISTISNATLSNLTSYGKITLSKSSFSYDQSGSSSGSDSTFDWSKVANYNLIYTTQFTSNDYHYVDDIYATLTTQPTSPVITTDEVRVSSIDPAAAPAGTKVTILGQNFGSLQGQSTLVFENTQTKASYTVTEIESWNDTAIAAIVPQQATAGSYNVKVVKVAISAGTLNAQESNNGSFKVTAKAAGAGSVVAYPNPFNPISTDSSLSQATISFSNTSGVNVGVYIYDMTARLVKKIETTGSSVSWNGYDSGSVLMGDGAYIIRVVDEQSKQLIASGKLMITKY